MKKNLLMTMAVAALSLAATPLFAQENITFDPANNSQLTELTTLTVDFGEPVELDQNYTYITNTDKPGDPAVFCDLTLSGNVLTLTPQTPIKEAGNYSTNFSGVWVPSLDDNCKAFYYFTILPGGEASGEGGDLPGMGVIPFYLTPETGAVTELKDFTLTFASEYTAIKVHEGATATIGDYTVTDFKVVPGAAAVTFSLPAAITADGTYKLSVNAGSFELTSDDQTLRNDLIQGEYVISSASGDTIVFEPVNNCKLDKFESLVVTFNEPVDLDLNLFYIYPATGNSIVCTGVLTNGNVLTITPNDGAITELGDYTLNAISQVWLLKTDGYYNINYKFTIIPGGAASEDPGDLPEMGAIAYDFSPKPGAVTELKDFTLTFSEEYTAAPLQVLEGASATIGDYTVTEFKVVEGAPAVTFSLPEAITADGTYKLSVSEGSFLLTGAEKSLRNTLIEADYVISNTVADEITFSPAEGIELSEFTSLVVTFNEPVDLDVPQFYVYPLAGGNSIACTGVVTNGNVLTITPDEGAITKPGDYQIPAASQVWLLASDKYYNFNYKFTIKNVLAGVDGVVEEDAESVIYNLQGVRVNGKLNELPAGLYIVGGKKTVVK